MKSLHKRAINSGHEAWQNLGFEHHTQAETLKRQKFFPEQTLKNLGAVALDVLGEQVRLAALPDAPLDTKRPDVGYGFLFLLKK